MWRGLEVGRVRSPLVIRHGQPYGRAWPGPRVNPPSARVSRGSGLKPFPRHGAPEAG